MFKNSFNNLSSVIYTTLSIDTRLKYRPFKKATWLRQPVVKEEPKINQHSCYFIKSLTFSGIITISVCKSTGLYVSSIHSFQYARSKKLNERGIERELVGTNDYEDVNDLKVKKDLEQMEEHILVRPFRYDELNQLLSLYKHLNKDDPELCEYVGFNHIFILLLFSVFTTTSA